MKKAFAKGLFAFRFAFQNIIQSKGKSLLLLLSFTLLFVIVLLGFNTKPVVVSYYYEQVESYYQDIDLVMRIGPNSSRRFFTIQPLKTMEDPFYEEMYPFFEIQTRLDVGSESTDILARMGSLNDLAKVIGSNTLSVQTLSATQTIITESLASKYSLQQEDVVSMNIGGATKEFQIVEIIPDDGLHQDNTIFIRKNENLSFFFSVLVPELAGLNPIFYQNLYNKAYFVLPEEVGFEEATRLLTTMNDGTYHDYQFIQAINMELIDQQVMRVVSVFYVVIFFVFFAVFLVMSTTFLRLFQQRRKSFAIIHLHGARWGFAFLVLLIEVLVLFGLSTIVSIVITERLMQYGLSMLGSNIGFSIHSRDIQWSSGIVGALFLGTSVWYFLKYYKKTAVEQTKESYEKTTIWKRRALWMLGLGFGCYGILALILNKLLVYPTNSLIVGVLTIVIMFVFAFLILHGVKMLLERFGNQSVFGMQIRGLFDRKSFVQFVSVVVVSFLSIFLLVNTNQYMQEKMNAIENEYQIDFALFNFVGVNRYEQTYEELMQNNQVASVDKVLMYRNVTMDDIDFNISFFVSIHPDAMEKYFELEFDESMKESLRNVEAIKVILPTRMQVSYGYQVGDSIRIHIDPNKDFIEAIVVGFVENRFSNIIFSNYHLMSSELETTTNALFVNGVDGAENLKSELLETYGKYMIGIYDFQSQIQGSLEEVSKTTSFVIYIIVVILGCFMLSLFNQSSLMFEEMKSQYAKMMVIGCSKWKLFWIVWTEKTLINGLLLVVSLASFLLIGNHLQGVVLFFGEYEPIGIVLKSLKDGVIIVLLVYLISSFYYGMKLVNIKIVPTIRLDS